MGRVGATMRDPLRRKRIKAETGGRLDGQAPPSGGVFRLERTSNLSEQHAQRGENHGHAERESRVGGEELHGKSHKSPLRAGRLLFWCRAAYRKAVTASVRKCRQIYGVVYISSLTLDSQ